MTDPALIDQPAIDAAIKAATKPKRQNAERLSSVMDYLRSAGYRVDRCSHFDTRTKRTRDMFTIADLAAVHPERDGLLLVQVTTKGHAADHRTKCRESWAWPTLELAGVAFALALLETVTLTATTGAKIQSHRIAWEMLLPGPSGRAHVFLQQTQLPMSGGRRRSRRGRASVSKLPPGVVAQ